LLSSDPAAAKAEYLKDQATLAANPEAKKSIEAAKAVYKQYNNGLIDFIVQCGFISKKEGDRLKQTPFIPFYRIENNEVKLFTDRESSIRIGNIKENPDLQRMLGDEKTILPILTSAVQNTFMLTRAGMKNQATHKTSDALYKAGFVSRIGKGSGPAGTDVVRYKVDGDDYLLISKYRRKVRRVVGVDDRKLESDTILVNPDDPRFQRTMRKSDDADELIVSRYWFEAAQFRLVKSIFNDLLRQRTLEISYNDFHSSEEQFYPAKCRLTISNPQVKQVLNYEITKLASGKAYEFPFEIPVDYVRRDTL
jgi:hypothetical protein